MSSILSNKLRLFHHLLIVRISSFVSSHSSEFVLVRSVRPLHLTLLVSVIRLLLRSQRESLTSFPVHQSFTWLAANETFSAIRLKFVRDLDFSSIISSFPHFRQTIEFPANFNPSTSCTSRVLLNWQIAWYSSTLQISIDHYMKFYWQYH